MWGATSKYVTKQFRNVFQFTHPVWGATPVTSLVVVFLSSVSIHAPRVGCDSLMKRLLMKIVLFQFTHPVWGATNYDTRRIKHTEVSIHAPRVGCDRIYCSASSADMGFQFTHPVWGATFLSISCERRLECFNSRTPCGVRLVIFQGHTQVRRFNSRTPCGVRPESASA